MNVHYGARALKELANAEYIAVPKGFTTFDANALPNFWKIHKEKPFTIFIGKRSQGWMSSDIAQLVENARILKSDVTPTEDWHHRFARFDLAGRTPAKKMIAQACEELSQGTYNMHHRDLVGVSYQTWRPEEYSYAFALAFMNVSSPGSSVHIRYKLQIEPMDACQHRKADESTYESNYRPNSGDTYQNVLDKGRVIFAYTNDRIGGSMTVAEGLLNQQVKESEPVFTNLYEFYGSKFPRFFDQETILATFKQQGLSATMRPGSPPSEEGLSRVRTLLQRQQNMLIEPFSANL